MIIRNDMLLTAKNTEHDCFYTIGGGIEVNETSEEAVVREIYEETGVKTQTDMLAFVQERFFKIKERRQHEIVFFYLIKNNIELNIAENSTSDNPKETFHWLPLKKLSDFNIVPEFLKTISFDNITKTEHIVSMEQ